LDYSTLHNLHGAEMAARMTREAMDD
jgi:hypothetical protein